MSKDGIQKKDTGVYTADYLWRRDCENRNVDLFQEFMEDIRKVYPVY
jgi:hypothetical protein